MRTAEAQVPGEPHDHHGGEPHGGHGDEPRGSEVPEPSGALGVAALATILLLVVEVVAALRSGSLSLLADAGHVATDLLALVMSWWAARLARRPADLRRTFGHHRGGILVAAANAVSLLVVAAYLLVEAWRRLDHPPEVEGGVMLVAATLAIAVNLVLTRTLSAHGSHDLNVRSAVLHLVGDVVASLGVIVAALLLRVRPDWGWLDPVMAAGIAVLIARSAVTILGDAVAVLMEEAPRGLDLESLTAKLNALPDVESVHDLHVWSISPGMTMLSCHLQHSRAEVMATQRLLDEATELLRHDFGITHSTLQLESTQCGTGSLLCLLQLPVASHAGHSHDHDHRGPVPVAVRQPAKAAPSQGSLTLSERQHP